MVGTPLLNALTAKIAFLEARASAGTARAIEFAALATLARARGDIRQAWLWTCRGFREDALDPEIEASLLKLAAQVPLSEAAPYLDLVLRYDDRASVLAEALRLRYGGESEPLVGRARAIEEGVEVWLTGRTNQPLSLVMHTDLGVTTTLLVPQADHPLSSAFGYAESLVIPWRPGMSFLDLQTEQSGLTWIQNFVHRPLGSAGITEPVSREDGSTTILIPVYGDAGSLSACLESLAADGECASERRILIINDASPDPDVTDVLAKAECLGADILTNARNLGFTASINRGLSHSRSGDVVLLNSDTLVPRHWLTRLRQVAATSPDIGTVTPLTNNGESVSAPLPFRNNPLPDLASINRQSEMLWSDYGCRAVDIPAGIGFCLFVTQAARAIGGFLDEGKFGRGYLEEVDFCLRVKNGGLRNVCAPGVYVGHRGEASFGLEKAYLVSRNAKVLRSLHPQHDEDYQAFALADPLREMRAKCTQSLPIADGARGFESKAEPHQQ